VRDRMVVFGGVAYGYGSRSMRHDAWALSLAGEPPCPPLGDGGDACTPQPPAWRELSPSGTPASGRAPSGRYGHAAIYDPVRDRMVVFGGFDGDSLRNDTWALSLTGTAAAWAKSSPSGAPPSNRAHHTATYDPVRDRMVVVGGNSPGGTYLDDIWSLAWTEPAANIVALLHP
jgi:galactose oxidase-like protein